MLREVGEAGRPVRQGIKPSRSSGTRVSGWLEGLRPFPPPQAPTLSRPAIPLWEHGVKETVRYAVLAQGRLSVPHPDDREQGPPRGAVGKAVLLGFLLRDPGCCLVTSGFIP